MILNADWWCTNFASFENQNQPCNQSMPYCTAIPRVVEWTFKVTYLLYQFIAYTYFHRIVFIA